MNESMLLRVGLVVGGMMVGGLIGAMIGYMVAENITERIVNLENEEFKEFKEVKEFRDLGAIVEPGLAPEASSEDSLDGIELEPPTKQKKHLRAKPDYEVSLLAKYGGVKQKDISVILYSQFEMIENVVPQTLTYYSGDDVLVDPHEVVITDRARFVAKCLSEFGKDKDDPDTIYVQNKILGTLYEIIRTEDSYKSSVMGDIDQTWENEED